MDSPTVASRVPGVYALSEELGYPRRDPESQRFLESIKTFRQTWVSPKGISGSIAHVWRLESHQQLLTRMAEDWFGKEHNGKLFWPSDESHIRRNGLQYNEQGPFIRERLKQLFFQYNYQAHHNRLKTAARSSATRDNQAEGSTSAEHSSRHPLPSNPTTSHSDTAPTIITSATSNIETDPLPDESGPQIPQHGVHSHELPPSIYPAVDLSSAPAPGTESEAHSYIEDPSAVSTTGAQIQSTDSGPTVPTTTGRRKRKCRPFGVPAERHSSRPRARRSIPNTADDEELVELLGTQSPSPIPIDSVETPSPRQSTEAVSRAQRIVTLNFPRGALPESAARTEHRVAESVALDTAGTLPMDNTIEVDGQPSMADATEAPQPRPTPRRPFAQMSWDKSPPRGQEHGDPVTENVDDEYSGPRHTASEKQKALDHEFLYVLTISVGPKARDLELRLEGTIQDKTFRQFQDAIRLQVRDINILSFVITERRGSGYQSVRSQIRPNEEVGFEWFKFRCTTLTQKQTSERTEAGRLFFINVRGEIQGASGYESS